MREMRRYRAELAAALAEWGEAGDVEGHVCGLIEGAHIEHRPETARAPRRKR